MPDVVLADDSPTIRKVVELSLVGEDLTLHCFADGASVLQYLRSGPVDVLLADASLPGLDGYELCRQVKLQPETNRVPVVLLAGTFEPFDVQRAQQVGCHSHLTKPFETSQLVSLVKKLVESGEVAEEPRGNSAPGGWMKGGAGGREAIPPESPANVSGVVPHVGQWSMPEPVARKETKTVNEKATVFVLTPQQCRPAPSLIGPEDWVAAEEPAAVPAADSDFQEAPLRPVAGTVGLGEAEIDLVVARVMEKLPGEFRRILSEALQDLTASR